MIFQNLFEFQKNIICIRFSDRHNWVFRPHWTTMLFAVIAAFTYTIYGIAVIFNTWFFYAYSDHDNIAKYSEEIGVNIYYTLEAVAHTFYYVYLFAVIRTSRKQTFQSKSSLIWWYISLTMLFIKIISFSLRYGLPLLGYNLLFSNKVYIGISVSTIIFIDASLIWLFVDGQNSVYIYWAQISNEEFKKYKSTERGHEALIEMTRYTVMGSISLGLNILTNLGGLIPEGVFIWRWIGLIITVVNLTSFVMAIYFMFPFGHASYLKCCGKCHTLVYDRFEHRNQERASDYHPL